MPNALSHTTEHCNYFGNVNNYVRNNDSLAHDNELIDPDEARFIYDAITAFLRFIKAVEAERFGA